MATGWPNTPRCVQSAGVLDFSFRTRICLVGADRVRFLHGQVTNDVKKLRVGGGCYAALITAKGKMETDLNIFCLAGRTPARFGTGPRRENFAAAGEIHRCRRRADRGRRAALRPVERARAEGGSRHPRDGIGCRQFRGAIRLREAFRCHARRNPSDEPPPPFFIPSPRQTGRGSGRGAKFYLLARPSSPFHGGEGEYVLCGFDLFVPNSSLGVVADKLIAAAKQIGAAEKRRRAGLWLAGVRDRAHRGGHRAGAAFVAISPAVQWR